MSRRDYDESAVIIETSDLVTPDDEARPSVRGSRLEPRRSSDDVDDEVASPILGVPSETRPTRYQMDNLPGTTTGHSGPSTGATSSGTSTQGGNFVPLEFMKSMMKEMMSTFLQATTSAAHTPPVMKALPRARNLDNIYLPSFDPDDRTDTVQIWCRHIEELKSEYQLNERETLNLARKNLKGRAADWARRNYTTLTSWEEIKTNLIQTFADESRYYDDLIAFMEYTSDKAESLSEYASRKWELAKKAIGIKVTELHLVDAVLSGMSDFRIRSDLLRLTPKTLPQLIQSLKSYKRKHPVHDTDHNVPLKKTRFNPQDFKLKRCQRCFKLGHLQRDCRTVFNNTSVASTSAAPQFHNAQSRNSQSNAQPQKKDMPIREPARPLVVCGFCHKPGHKLENCFKRLNQKPKNEKSINSLIVSNNRSMLVKVDERDFTGLIDSGAECSLMRESIGDSISGKTSFETTMLRGVGENSFCSSRKKTTRICIDGLNLELEFVLVPDHYIQYDLLLGENLFDIPGIQIIFSQTETKIYKTSYSINFVEKIDLATQVNTDVDINSKKQLLKLLNEYTYLFTSGNSVTQINTGELSIRLKNPDKTVQRRPYRLAPIERENVKKIVQDLKENGIVRDSNSPFSSPILLVRKKDGSDRLCVDYRELNSNTVRDHFPLPLIDDHIGKLVNAKFFTILDMAAGFHQIPVAPDSIEKTAFVTPDGQFEFLRMPFGLCNAPSVFQRAINAALKLYVDVFVLIYIDDVILFSNSIDEGLENLNKVLDSLKQAGFSLNIKKCKFLKTEIEYLGRVICNSSVRPSPGKVQALIRSPVPGTVKQVRQFCGLAGYFRKFIPDFSQTMSPLYHLTKADTKWNWTSEHDSVREKIIQHLSSEPTLALFDPTKPIELHTDASSTGFGAVLLQKHDAELKVVEYFSMRTTDTENRYHSYELETLAVVKAIKHFRHYLFGKTFKLVTDCNSLKASRNKKELLPRVHRWWAYLQSFDFDIEYRKGERIPHVDFLSRNPTTLNINNVLNYTDWLEVEQKNDSESQDIMKSIKDGTIDQSLASSYEIKNDLLHRVYNTKDGKMKKSLFVPKSFRWHIIQTYHDSLKHLGWEKTLDKIRERFWFPNMSKNVRKYVENCLSCRVNKSQSGSRQTSLHPIEKVPVPFHTVHMDTTGKLTGNKLKKQYAVVFIDAFTKYCLIKPVTNLTAVATVNCLKDLIHTFGTPKRIVCDQAASYTGKELRNFCSHWSIELHFIASGISRANGQVERLMKVLTDCFTVVENTTKRGWKDSVGEVQLAINCSFNKSTGLTPFQLLMGCNRSPPAISALVNDIERLDLDACRQLAKHRMDERASKQKIQFDKTKAKVVPFKVGDIVLVKQNPRTITKLDSKYKGPCVIVDIHENERYTVKVHDTGNELYVSHETLRLVSPDNGCELTESLSTT